MSLATHHYVAGADVNSADQEGNTALHKSVDNGSLDCCRILIEKGGASMDCRNNTGLTPVDLSAMSPEGLLCASYLLEQVKQRLSLAEQEMDRISLAKQEELIKEVILQFISTCMWIEMCGIIVLPYSSYQKGGTRTEEDCIKEAPQKQERTREKEKGS